jgi:YHS domain-containing protein
MNEDEKDRQPLANVCHRTMTTAPENYYRAEYQGRTIYFCTVFCLDTFNADPDRFYAAHSRIHPDPKSNQPDRLDR